MTNQKRQKDNNHFESLLKQGIFEDEIADMVFEKVLNDSSFDPIVEKYKSGKIDEFDFVDAVWQKFNDQLE
jgi:hypothetical protein